MSNQEDAWERLDAEFDHFLVDMKPYILKLPQKQERQRCALWIKKLCDPSGAGAGITGRKNRNLHTKLLLHMLKRGVLEGPFTQKPEAGMLKTLPTYMSIYFDEPNTSRSQTAGSDGLPDWVLGELETSERTDDSWKMSLKEDPASGMSPPKQQYQYRNKLTSRSLSSIHRLEEDNLALHHTRDHLKKTSTSLDDSDIEARLNSWNLGIENPRYLREKPIPLSPISPKTSLGKSASLRDEQVLLRLHEKEISPKRGHGKSSTLRDEQVLLRLHEKEMLIPNRRDITDESAEESLSHSGLHFNNTDMKIKALEAKFHEEKLKLQQKHDADVQKILDRKNRETEDLKTHYRSKQNESEETIRKLEKKVQTLLRESQVIRESKESQITELKKLCEQSTETLKNEWEKKLHDAVADMEKEKLELQRKHTDNIQELLDDTNTRLQKMESDYMAQTKAITLTVKELEARVQQMTIEAENSNLQRQKLSQENVELEKLYQAADNELQELQTRCTSLIKERDRLTQDYEKRIQQLQSKYDSDLSYITQQNAVSAAKASDVIEELELRVSQLKQHLEESEHQRQQQLRDQESKFQKEKLHLERQNEKKVHNLHKELEEATETSQKKLSKAEAMLKERDEQLTRLTEVQRLQAQQADTALEEFKRQVEANTEKVYSEMKQQMEKVEGDLSLSKFLREKQTKEYTRQLEELKQSYEQKIVELKLEYEQEKTYLFQQHNTEKEGIIKDHEQEIDRLEKQLRSAMSEHEKKTQAWRQQDAQTISNLEAQVYKLKEELIKVNTQRKQQLVELEQLRDEENHKTAQEHDAAMNKLRTDMELMKLNLEKSHATQTEQTIEKANSRLKQIEKEYKDKLAKSTQMVSELQATISSMQQETSQKLHIMERRLQETSQKHEEEKRHLMKENEKTIKLLKDEVENYCTQLRSAEKQLQERELSMQEQVTNIRQDYELKMKGLMPKAMRQELEDTITSLKSQVNFLQKRANILQEELQIYQRKM
ncbi:centrosomal protein of 112 kDa [Bombina bombina]|uniref:centrosomal protein of 112 kDa n=1 Tax=Bombina bombina TaxID=8345 RepID=UPI00235AA116|nr:centrosomal protein of 112 kDa [Bombina bombina]